MTRVRSAFLLLICLLLVTSSCSSAALDDLLAAAGVPDRALDRETVVAGLREALEVGSDRTVERTSAVDGFLADELIRIAIPPELQAMTDALRTLGLGRRVDDLEVGMNRAAEGAAGEAREILWSEIRELTIPDAMAILGGGPTAATEHLRERTEARIRARFRPIVVSKMDEVGLARLYADLAERYNRLPLVSRPALDLDAYVTDRALSGLFTVLGNEERRIREDPVARTTELLRRVFGQAPAAA